MYLEFLLSGNTPFFDIALESTDRILGAPHPLDLLARSVSGSGVRHPMKPTVNKRYKLDQRLHVRVSSVTVSDEFDEKRTVTLDGPLTRMLHCVLDSDDIHSVDLKTRDLVTTGKVLRVLRTAFC